MQGNIGNGGDFGKGIFGGDGGGFDGEGFENENYKQFVGAIDGQEDLDRLNGEELSRRLRNKMFVTVVASAYWQEDEYLASLRDCGAEIFDDNFCEAMANDLGGEFGCWNLEDLAAELMSRSRVDWDWILQGVIGSPEVNGEKARGELVDVARADSLKENLGLALSEAEGVLRRVMEENVVRGRKQLEDGYSTVCWNENVESNWSVIETFDALLKQEYPDDEVARVDLRAALIMLLFGVKENGAKSANGKLLDEPILKMLNRLTKDSYEWRSSIIAGEGQSVDEFTTETIKQFVRNMRDPLAFNTAMLELIQLLNPARGVDLGEWGNAMGYLGATTYGEEVQNYLGMFNELEQASRRLKEANFYAVRDAYKKTGRKRGGIDFWMKHLPGAKNLFLSAGLLGDKRQIPYIDEIVGGEGAARGGFIGMLTMEL